MRMWCVKKALYRGALRDVGELLPEIRIEDEAGWLTYGKTLDFSVQISTLSVCDWLNRAHLVSRARCSESEVARFLPFSWSPSHRAVLNDRAKIR